MLPALVEWCAHSRILLDSPALLHFDDATRLQVVVADLPSIGLGFSFIGIVAAELARRIGSDDPASCKCLVSLPLPAGYARTYFDALARLTRMDLGADRAFLEQVVEESVVNTRAAVMQLLS
jgi:hypothetical protein